MIYILGGGLLGLAVLGIYIAYNESQKTVLNQNPSSTTTTTVSTQTGSTVTQTQVPTSNINPPTLPSHIIINPTISFVGNSSWITITGSGFTPNGNVSIISSAGNVTIGEFNNTQGTVASTTADSSGNINVPISFSQEGTFLRNLGLPVSQGIGANIQLETFDSNSKLYSNKINVGYQG